MQSKRTSHTIDLLFTFLLMLTFLLFSLLLAQTGATVYRKGADSLNETYTSQTALSYVTEKLRQHDCDGSVSLSSIDQIPALILSDDLEGASYRTYIYYYDGALRELFTRASTKVTPEMGSAIVELSGFHFKPLTVSSAVDSGLLLFLCVTGTDGEEQSELIHLCAKNG